MVTYVYNDCYILLLSCVQTVHRQKDLHRSLQWPRVVLNLNRYLRPALFRKFLRLLYSARLCSGFGGPACQRFLWSWQLVHDWRCLCLPRNHIRFKISVSLWWKFKCQIANEAEGAVSYSSKSLKVHDLPLEAAFNGTRTGAFSLTCALVPNALHLQLGHCHRLGGVDFLDACTGSGELNRQIIQYCLSVHTSCIRHWLFIL